MLSAVRDGANDYEGGAEPTTIVIIDYKTQEIRHSWEQLVQTGTRFPIFNRFVGTPTIEPTAVGFSRDTCLQIVPSEKMNRLNLATGQFVTGVNGGLDATKLFLERPAMMSEGGKPWVVGYDLTNPDKGAWTGPWLNMDAGSDLANPGFAYLTSDEWINRLDDKPGWVEITSTTGWLAYTRRNSLDYCLVVEDGNYYYYDGRLAEWFPAPIACRNLYVTVEGDVIFAQGEQVYYKAIDGNDWLWNPTGGSDGTVVPSISVGGDWVQVKGLVIPIATALVAAGADITAFGTPTFWGDDFAIDPWVRNWNLSCKGLNNGAPVAVPHRTHAWKDENAWAGDKFDYFINPVYATLPLYEHPARNDSGHLQLYSNNDVGLDHGMNFDAVPYCPCCGGSDPHSPY